MATKISLMESSPYLGNKPNNILLLVLPLWDRVIWIFGMGGLADGLAASREVHKRGPRRPNKYNNNINNHSVKLGLDKTKQNDTCVNTLLRL